MKKLILVLVFVLAFALIATACEFSVTTANLQDVNVASEVDEETFAPVTITDTFTTTAPIIYITGTVFNAPEGTIVSANWYYLDEVNGGLITSVEFETVETSTALLFDLSKPDNDWPVGEYGVDLLINGELEDTVYFSVE